jgi:GDP-L-fucose synthase
VEEMSRASRVYVAGHGGLVGSAIVRALRQDGFENILTATRDQLDLRDQAAVNYWFKDHRPEYVFLVAGKVGGILANSTYPADFLYDNLLIHATTIHASYRQGVEKLLYLGSSCIYPRLAPQPISEDSLLTGLLEPTNEMYAIAKIAGIKMCEAYRAQYGCNFISAMPTNLYGPGDNFDLASGHVLPAMIRKFHEAKDKNESTVTIWGTGTPRREFLYVDDLAAACLFLMRQYNGHSHINVGTGQDITIAGVAELVRSIVYPEASLVFDTTKPDGTPRKVLDTSVLNELGFHPRVGLKEGIAQTYGWFLEYEASKSRAGDIVSVGAR